MGTVLRRQVGGVNIPTEPIKDRSGRVVVQRKHNTLPQLLQHGVLSAQERLGLLVAGTTRNPFDWLVSQYLRGLPIREGSGSGLFTADGKRSKGDPQRTGSKEDFEAWIVGRYERRRRGPLGRVLPARARKQVNWLEGVDAVMRFERLQETFDEVLLRVGITEHLEIPRVNETVSRDIRDFRPWYTPKARAIAEKAFTDYLARYDYSFD